MSTSQHRPVPLGRPTLGQEEEQAVLRVMASGRLTQGPEVQAFEEELAAACGRRWAVVVSSGTAALHLALWAADVGPGTTVRVPDFTFPATANVVRLLGGMVELVDVDAHTWCMRRTDANGAASTNVRTLTVHQFGFPAPVLDGDLSDAACAAGVVPAMRGQLACLSFHPRKVLTTGEGGAIVGDDDGLRDALRTLRSHGLVPRPDSGRFMHFDIPSHAPNYRLADMGAAMGRVQLRRLPDFLAERRVLVERYRRHLDGSGLEFQADAPGRAWQTVAVVLPDHVEREALRGRLADAGIESQVASYGLHTLGAYAANASEFPVADRLHRKAMALPLWNGLPEADVDRVCEVLLRSLEQLAQA